MTAEVGEQLWQVSHRRPFIGTTFGTTWVGFVGENSMRSRFNQIV